MKNTKVILYTGGCYGHLINWCCDYFSGNIDSDELPINDIGNCHAYNRAKILTFPPQFIEYTESLVEWPFVQLHECSINLIDYDRIRDGKFIDVLTENLTYLEKHYKKIIYVYPTKTSKIWITNNQLYKIRISDWFGTDITLAENIFKKYKFSEQRIEEHVSHGLERIKKQIKNEKGIEGNFLQWGHKNINDFALWELRELASKYYYDKTDNIPTILDQIKLNFQNVLFIELDSLRDDFQNTIKNILDHFTINTVNWNKIDDIHQNWIPTQIYINRDQQINQIVNSLINCIDLDWKSWQLTFFDESVIQRKLFDHDIDIKCWNLNEFPTNTKDFLQLLERK
jgi:hypothetical protein